MQRRQVLDFLTFDFPRLWGLWAIEDNFQLATCNFQLIPEGGVSQETNTHPSQRKPRNVKPLTSQK
jgi:hypothetical protein